MSGLVRIWYSEKYDVNFLGIPKTASSSIRKMLEIDVERDWYEVEKGMPIPGSRTITCLREPVARFMSGYYEAKRRNSWLDGSPLDMLLEIEGGGFIDEHLLPQMHYLKTFWDTGNTIDHHMIIGSGRLSVQMKNYFDTSFPAYRENKTVASEMLFGVSPLVGMKIKAVFKEDSKYYDLMRSIKGYNDKK